MTAEIKDMEPGGEVSATGPKGSVEPNERASSAASLDVAVQALLSPVREWMCRIEQRIDGPHDGVTTQSPADLGKIVQGMAELREEIQSLRKDVSVSASFADIASELAEFRKETKSCLEKLANPGHAPTVATQTKPDPQDHHRWEQVLLGQELVQNPELSKVRQQLLDDILAGQDAARSLAGQTMLLQSAAVNQIPELMRDVGEAYYHWRPRTAASEEPLERALASWLMKHAAAVGLRNTIELVCPGDRFDASRHVAAERGAEIVAVYGWVVLRENGKVFTRANVTVK